MYKHMQLSLTIFIKNKIKNKIKIMWSVLSAVIVAVVILVISFGVSAFLDSDEAGFITTFLLFVSILSMAFQYISDTSDKPIGKTLRAKILNNNTISYLISPDSLRYDIREGDTILLNLSSHKIDDNNSLEGTTRAVIIK